MAIHHWTPPLNLVEKLAKEARVHSFGYANRVLFLPPYHPEYNAIELAWARVKHYIAKNPTYEMETILNYSLPGSIDELTPHIANNIVNHVINKWREDMISEIDPMNITMKIQYNLQDDL